MSETLPPANRTIPSVGGRIARAAARQTLALGSAAFNKMFPTLGRVMGSVGRPRESVTINASSEEITTNLFRQRQLMRNILDNQNEQNRLLERLLQVYKGRSTLVAAPALPPPMPTPGGYPSVDLPMLDRPDRRTPPRPQQAQQQRPAPNRQRTWFRRYLTFVKRRSPRVFRAASRRLAVAAAGTAVPGPGWLLSFISALGSVFLAYELFKLYQEFTASNSEEEDENIESNLPGEEEAAAEERRLQEEAERELFGDVSQIGVQEGEETEAERAVRLQQAAQAERQRQQAGLAANLEDPRRQEIIERLARQRQIASQPGQVGRAAARNIPAIERELELYNRANPISQRDAQLITATPPVATPPARQSREQLLTSRTTQLQASIAAAQVQAQAIDNQLLQSAQTVGSTQAATQPAVRVEGDTIIYDFDRIKFEADLIKFDGLSLPTRQTVAQPSPPPPAVPTPTAAGPSFPSVGATAAGPTGPRPMQVSIQPPTASPAVQAMMERRQQQGGNPSTGSAAAAIQFFQSRGWTPAQAAGFAANLQVESNFNPNAVGDGGRAYGIAQWHPDRQAAFQRWAGRDIRGSTFEQQLEFMQFELTQGNERRAGTIIRQATTPEQAAALIDQHYERSNGHARQRRMQLAASYASNMPVMAGQQPVAAPSSAPTALAQASTERVVAEREQMRNTQMLINTFNARQGERPALLHEQSAARLERKQQQAVGEVPLRNRILEVFNHLAQAS